MNQEQLKEIRASNVHAFRQLKDAIRLVPENEALISVSVNVSTGHMGCWTEDSRTFGLVRINLTTLAKLESARSRAPWVNNEYELYYREHTPYLGLVSQASPIVLGEPRKPIR